MRNITRLIELNSQSLTVQLSYDEEAAADINCDGGWCAWVRMIGSGAEHGEGGEVFKDLVWGTQPSMALALEGLDQLCERHIKSLRTM